MRAFVLIVATLTLAACARRGEPPALSVATGRSCDAARVTMEHETPWREMRGDGFTYCVPPGWSPIGSRAQRWTSKTVDLEWGVPDGFQRRVPFVVASRGQTGARFGARVVTEKIDDTMVRLEIEDGTESQFWRAAAASLEPALRLYATARTATGSQEVMAVLRSVRFSR